MGTCIGMCDKSKTRFMPNMDGLDEVHHVWLAYMDLSFGLPNIPMQYITQGHPMNCSAQYLFCRQCQLEGKICKANHKKVLTKLLIFKFDKYCQNLC